MALQFTPFPLPPEQPPQRSKYAEASDTLQNLLQTYLGYKLQNETAQAQREARLVDLAKAGAEGGQEFWNTYAALRAGRNPMGIATATNAPKPPASPAATPTPAPANAEQGYALIQDPYGPLPRLTDEAPMMSSISPAPQMSSVANAPQIASSSMTPSIGPTPPPAPQTATDITPEYLDQIKRQKGTRGLKEFQDVQEFLLKRRQGEAQMMNLNLDNESKLRGDYTRASQAFKTVADNMQNIESVSARQPSAAGDISLIFSYMKLNDPNSVVREGEYATAANAAGIPDRLRALYNRLLSGEKLAPAQRADFIKTAGDLYQGWQSKQGQIDESYRNIATRSRVNPENVVIPFGLQNFDRAALAKSPAVLAQGGGASPTVNSFASVQAAEAANLPKGTVVMIGGRKAVIE